MGKESEEKLPKLDGKHHKNITKTCFLVFKQQVGCILNTKIYQYLKVELGEAWRDLKDTRQRQVLRWLWTCVLRSSSIPRSRLHQVTFSRHIPGCSTAPSWSNSFREPKPKASRAWRFSSSTVEVEEMERLAQRPLARHTLISCTLG